VLTSKDRRRGGELIVLPTRIVKRHRH